VKYQRTDLRLAFTSQETMPPILPRHITQVGRGRFRRSSPELRNMRWQALDSRMYLMSFVVDLGSTC